MVGIGEGGGEVGRPGFRRPVDAGLEGIALAGAEPLRQAPAGAGAGKCEARDGVGCQAIIEPAGKPRHAGGEIVAADHRRITAGAAGAAEARAPRRPALPEGGSFHRRRLEHRGIGERNVLGQRSLLRRKGQCRAAHSRNAAAAVDERIEHQSQELAG